MKKLYAIVLLMMTLVFITSSKNKQVNLFLVGDSTMADKEPVDETPERGWGMVLPSFFNQNVKIENHARNGRSTRTFIAEGRWNYMISRVGKGDFVFLQFGHNDQSKDKVDRYTPIPDYVKNLARMVNDVRRKGATPILCTPVMRRKFDKDGIFIDQHGEYPNAIRELARKMNVLLIDMHLSSGKVIVNLGPEESKKLFMHIEPGKWKKHPDGKIDNTHFVEYGAMEMAKLAVDGINQLNIKPLKRNLLKDMEIKVKNNIPVPGLDNIKP